MASGAGHEAGACLVGPDAQGDELGDYLSDLACDGLPWPELAPEVPYELAGVYAGERESAGKGWDTYGNAGIDISAMAGHFSELGVARGRSSDRDC